MNKYNLKVTFIENATINDTQIFHTWTNALLQQCHFGTTQAHWIDHTPIYFVFKLSNYVSQFVLPHNTIK